MKRRTILTALGALATGSGTVATTASLSDTAQSSSSFRVIAPQELVVRAGKAFESDGTVRATNGFGPTESDSNYNYSDYYVANATHGSFFTTDNGLKDISQTEVPVATVNRRDEYINSDVEIQTAISILNELDVFVFENILEVENKGGEQIDIAIKYENHYGSDVDVGSTNFEQDIVEDDVQHIYKFYLSPPQTNRTYISPDPNTTPVEEPNTSYGIAPGETVQLDLEIDLTPWGGRTTSVDPKIGIRNATGNRGFTGGADTVDLLDAIEIGRWSDSG